jgi:predicted flap endonuclease-1-like 5' DNA nuclease
MKKFAILVSLAIAAPVFACPGMDHEKSTATAKADKPVKTDKATTAPAKTDAAKDTAKAAPAKDTKDAKKPDKVSAK